MSKFFNRKIEPDFKGFKDCILRKTQPMRVFFAEMFLDSGIRDKIIERFCINCNLDRNDPVNYYRAEIALQKFLGYDMVRCCITPVFPDNVSSKTASFGISEDAVASGPIQNWKDFELYPWPEISSLDFSPLDWLEKELPQNMKCYVTAPVGIYKMLLGYEDMLYMMYDSPDLMKAVLEKVNAIHADFARTVCGYSCVGVLWGSDDMGFKSQTFFPPDYIRETILPVHQTQARIAHESGKLYFLHACGNLSEVMDDLIDAVKIDAKHSFEDAIVPVTEMKRRYGDKIALLGGIDMDFLCRANETDLRKKVRNVLDICLPNGGYCLGSGNSIADYVPMNNFLIMLDEGRNYL